MDTSLRHTSSKAIIRKAIGCKQLNNSKELGFIFKTRINSCLIRALRMNRGETREYSDTMGKNGPYKQIVSMAVRLNGELLCCYPRVSPAGGTDL